MFYSPKALPGRDLREGVEGDHRGLRHAVHADDPAAGPPRCWPDGPMLRNDERWQKRPHGSMA